MANPYREWADVFDWENYLNNVLLDTVTIAGGFPGGHSSLSSLVDEGSGEKLTKRMRDLADPKTDSERRREYLTGF